MAMKPITITLTTQRQVNALFQALQMQYDMVNDCVLDETITTVEELRTLASKSYDEIRADLNTRREDTNKSIDILLSTIDCINKLQNAIDRQHD